MTELEVTLGDAILARLRTALETVTVYDGRVPSSTPTAPLPGRYAVLYVQTPVRTWEDLAHNSDLRRLWWQVTSVGATRPEAAWIADRVGDALVDQRLQITGLDCEPVEHESSQPIRWDDDVPGRVVMFGADTYGCNATVAPA